MRHCVEVLPLSATPIGEEDQPLFIQAFQQHRACGGSAGPVDRREGHRIHVPPAAVLSTRQRRLQCADGLRVYIQFFHPQTGCPRLDGREREADLEAGFSQSF